MCSSKLENLAFIFLADVLLGVDVENYLLVVVMRGAFRCCWGWGWSKEAREGKPQLLYLVIKLSLSPWNSESSKHWEISM